MGYSFGLGGGNSRATTLSAKPIRLWAPSQNGLLAEWPQRQSEITVRPASPKEAPVGSTISNSPSIRMGPLFCGLILVGIFGSYHRLGTENRFLAKTQRTRRSKELFLLRALCVSVRSILIFGGDGSFLGGGVVLPTVLPAAIHPHCPTDAFDGSDCGRGGRKPISRRAAENAENQRICFFSAASAPLREISDCVSSRYYFFLGGVVSSTVLP